MNGLGSSHQPSSLYYRAHFRFHLVPRWLRRPQPMRERDNEGSRGHGTLGYTCGERQRAFLSFTVAFYSPSCLASRADRPRHTGRAPFIACPLLIISPYLEYTCLATPDIPHLTPHDTTARLTRPVQPPHHTTRLLHLPRHPGYGQHNRSDHQDIVV
ncbi:hypothetical protein E2C01_040719 [Portunus trituberculatus]|uniref:Uncharacterized protein n=1 Tax=Portunus trituberculatus TaxID=210409 RepID=A0A5B7FND0_PORTR|nr:hypothetical protein [Portunus trituberculatus]